MPSSPLAAAPGGRAPHPDPVDAPVPRRPLPPTPPSPDPAGAAELDRQVDVLVAAGWPAAAGLDEAAFRALAAPLASRTPAGPFVLVVTGRVVAPHVAVGLTSLHGRPGFTTMAAVDVARFAPIAGVAPPAQEAYLVEDVDCGEATRGLRPDDALPGLLAAGRTPLTLDEGVAVVAQHPEWLRERTCFEMLGSRAGDRRVTGLWVSGGQPRLGWCWAGNPHTWLGMASAARRLG